MRIIGALLILCSAFFIANKAVAEVERTLCATSALRVLMEQIKNMIECYSMPIGKILEKIDPLTFKKCGYEGEGAPADLLDLSKGAVVPDGESFEIFSSFAKDFGKGYREDELLRCAMFLERMRSREQKLSKEIAKKKRVITTVSLCTALAVVILLI